MSDDIQSAVVGFASPKFDREIQSFFKDLLGRDPPFDTDKIKEMQEALDEEARGEDNFVEQLDRIYATKRSAEKSIRDAMAKANKLLRPGMLFPKTEKEADDVWEDLGKHLETLEKHLPDFIHSIRAFMTIYLHQFRNLEAGIRATQDASAVIGTKEEEIEFLESELMGLFKFIYTEIGRCLEKVDILEETLQLHVAAHIEKDHTLYGSAMEKFSEAFNKVSENERYIVRQIQIVFKRNKKKLSKFEKGADLVSRAAKENQQMALAYFSDKVLAYFTLGNALTVVAYTTLVVTTGPTSLLIALRHAFTSKVKKRLGKLFSVASDVGLVKLKNMKMVKKVLEKI
jgi:hypothetical protein